MNEYDECRCPKCIEQRNEARMDLLSFGTGILKRDADGHVQRIDPADIDIRTVNTNSEGQK